MENKWHTHHNVTVFAGASVSSAIESNLYRRVHAILRELDTDNQAHAACNKGTAIFTSL